MNGVRMLCALISTLMAAIALAQSYPTKPIRMLVPFPAGGAVDITARALGAELTRSLGQQIVVENRTGAGGNIAAEAAARAAPDGYTLFMATSAILAVNPVLYAKVPFDPIKDFAPVSVVAAASNVLIIHPSVPATSVAELIALARANPGKYSYGSSGSGTSTHLAAEMFRMLADVDLLHVPYKGGPPSLVDLVAGQVNMVFELLPTAVPLIRSGKVRALGSAGARRSPLLPDVPLISEMGLPGYESTVWFGVAVPAGTPVPIVNHLSAEIAGAVKQPELRDRLTGMGYEISSTTPERMAEMVRGEISKWSRVVKAAGLRIE
ncbi:MAG: Bug family tripartite tricarboxylate transporter substrate binding protein [Burkholderiales bacterium]